MHADAVVVGAGLAGLVATAEPADAGRRVILLDQEPETGFGGQAFWSLGGLTASSPTRTPRTARSRPSTAPAPTARTASRASPRPIGSWTPRRGR